MSVNAAVDIANIALSRLGQATITTLTAAGRDAGVVNELYADVRNYCMMLFDWGSLVHRQVLGRSGSVALSAATAANPVVVTTTPTHTYVANELITIEGAGGMTQLNGGVFRIWAVTSTTITLYDTDGTTTNGTSFSAYTSGGSVFRHAGADWEYVYDLPSDTLMVQSVLDEDFGFSQDYEWRKERSFIYADIENAGVQYVRADTDVTHYEEDLIEVIVARLAWYISMRVSGDKQLRQMMFQEYQEALARAKVTNARGRRDEGLPPQLWTDVR